jgi:hypothetical protein
MRLRTLNTLYSAREVAGLLDEKGVSAWYYHEYRAAGSDIGVLLAERPDVSCIPIGTVMTVTSIKKVVALGHHDVNVYVELDVAGKKTHMLIGSAASFRREAAFHDSGWEWFPVWPDTNYVEVVGPK